MHQAPVSLQRLRNQRLVGDPFEKAEDAVRWLGAVQSQDYAGAKWALGQRTRGVTDADLDQLFAEGAILRTHVLRPTWHFVAREEIRWILALTAPRVHALNAYYYRQLELDDAIFARANRAFTEALQGGRHLTRAELVTVLADAGIIASGVRLGYIVIRAELDAVITSGPRRGRQFTYALFAERAPDAAVMDRDEALAELTRRYFTSHGPALLQDFVWWSSLTAADARAGIEMAGTALEKTILDGKTYWFAPATKADGGGTSSIHLLPNFDEFLIGYSDYSPVSHPAVAIEDRKIRDSALGGHILVIDGKVVGGWRRTFEKKEAIIELRPLVELDAVQMAAIESVARDYGRFLGAPVSVVGGR